jgi:hypothetical protein
MSPGPHIAKIAELTQAIMWIFTAITIHIVG